MEKIIRCKKKYDRYSEVIHQYLKNDGIEVGLNSVRRKIDQTGIMRKRNPWKRLHLSDVHSYLSFAWAVERIGAAKSLEFIEIAQIETTFKFNCIQSDDCEEFTRHFTERIDIPHRHCRIRRPIGIHALKDSTELLRKNACIIFKEILKYSIWL